MLVLHPQRAAQEACGAGSARDEERQLFGQAAPDTPRRAVSSLPHNPKWWLSYLGDALIHRFCPSFLD